MHCDLSNTLKIPLISANQAGEELSPVTGNHPRMVEIRSHVIAHPQALSELQAHANFQLNDKLR